jgi:hypothetical protein
MFLIPSTFTLSHITSHIIIISPTHHACQLGQHYPLSQLLSITLPILPLLYNPVLPLVSSSHIPHAITCIFTITPLSLSLQPSFKWSRGSSFAAQKLHYMQCCHIYFVIKYGSHPLETRSYLVQRVSLPLLWYHEKSFYWCTHSTIIQLWCPMQE